MPNLINYAATAANTLENCDLMTRAAPTKLYADISPRFWSFHEMFMNHIENMGWIASLVSPNQAHIKTLRKILDKSE